MKINKNILPVAGMGCAVSLGIAAAMANDAADTPTITPRTMADALHMVMDSDRAVYTRRIVNRLAAKDKVITASEHFEDEKALVLPAQMFRCLLYTSPSPRDRQKSRMPSSA